MKETEFNLIDSPWIRVLDKTCTTKEVSIRDALLDSHKYIGIRGDLASQDAAILRMLLAILLRVFLEKDQDGNYDPLVGEEADTESALERWTAIWESGKIPEAPVNEYLDKWHERFWLFHPEFPFFQVPNISGTKYESKKLNGRLSTSGNKHKLFRGERTDETENILTYPEAARWLICLNAFDDASVKVAREDKSQKFPGSGVGWLGKIGLVYPEGETLFQTLMYNLTLLKDGEDPWAPGHPVWENDSPKREQRTEIAIPQNPVELLTVQSRRIILQREDGIVTGYVALGGDFFSLLNATTEQMTAWTVKKNGKRPTSDRMPKAHDIKKAAWREFPTLIMGEGGSSPGVVKWLEKLSQPGWPLADKVINFKTVTVTYGNSNGCREDLHGDSIGLHAGVLADLTKEESVWATRIKDEVERCEKTASWLNLLERDVRLASGDRPKTTHVSASEQYFEAVDAPFRRWLYSLDPSVSLEDSSDLFKEWQKTSMQIATDVAESLVREAGPAAFTGRWVQVETGKKTKGKKEKEKKYFSSPNALNFFKYALRKTYSENQKEEK